MVSFTFSTNIALDAQTSHVARAAVGVICAPEDATHAALPITLADGQIVTSITTSSDGLIPSFTIDDLSSVVFYSAGADKSWAFLLSADNVPGPPGQDGVDGVGLSTETMVVNGALVLSREDGTQLEPVPLPTPAEVTDPTISDLVMGQTQTRASVIDAANQALPDAFNAVTGVADVRFGKMIAGGSVTAGRYQPLKGTPATVLLSRRRIRTTDEGCIQHARWTFNAQPNPLLAGGKPGVIGAGGLWPAGVSSQTGAYTFEILEAPGDGTLTVKVTKPGTVTAARASLLFGSKELSAPLPLSGTMLSSCDIEILAVTETTGQFGRLSMDANTKTGGSDTGVAAHPAAGLSPTKADIGANPAPMLAFGPVEAGQWVQPAVRIENVTSETQYQANAWSVTFRLSRPQIEYSTGTLDRSEFTTTGYRLADELSLTIPEDGTYDVLITGKPGARWATLTSEHGVLALPAPARGGEAVSGVYVFTPGLSVEEKNTALESLDPPRWEQGTAVLTSRFTLSDDGRAQDILTRRYVQTAPVDGWGQGTDNIPVGHAFATPINRAGMERYEVRPGDQADPVTASPTRSEMVMDYTASNVVPNSQDFWASWWTNVDTPISPQYWAIITQVHQSDAATVNNGTPFPPLWALTFEGWASTTNFRYIYRSSTLDLPNTNPFPPAGQAGALNSGGITDPVPYTFGTWTHHVLHISPRPNANGTFSLWRDGRQVIDQAGPIGFLDPKGSVFQRGIYTNQTDGAFRLTHAGVHWGTTDLSDHINNPPPIS